MHEISERRKRAGLTQEEVAQRSGVTYSSISRIERGKRWPQLTVLERIAEALGTRAPCLLKWGCALIPGEEKKFSKLKTGDHFIYEGRFFTKIGSHAYENGFRVFGVSEEMAVRKVNIQL